MRYVIIVVVITGFLIWDGFRNDGHYLAEVVGTLRHLFRLIGI